MEDTTPTPVHQEILAAHVLNCRWGQRVEEMGAKLNRVWGVLVFLAAMVPVLSALGMWALNRAAAKQDELQKALQDVRVLVEHRHTQERGQGYVAQVPK